MKKQLLLISALFFSIISYSQSITTGDLDFGTQNMTLNTTVNTGTDVVTITVTGPQTRWFGIGFDASFMNGAYTLIFKENSGTIEERQLSGHTSGSALATQDISITSDTNDGTIRTVILTRPRLGTDASSYDFPTTDGSTTNIIWGYGPSGGSFDTATFMGGHSPGGVLITFNNSLSIEDFNNALSDAVFYPNPSTGKINIENGRKIKTIEIYDMTGRVVREINYLEQTTNSIDLSDLKSGMYAALLLGDNNLKAMKRIVIQ
ncbi:MAG: T9SS type A sorting domain-containing protein [Urechidicola sp.]|nr:T9SS type A sorting domain-containing protein [Urechidicola sp.]